MPITAVLLQIATGREEAVRACLEEKSHLDIHEVTEGCIVVTTDTETIDEDRNLTEELGQIPDVLMANVVFSNMEDCVV